MNIDGIGMTSQRTRDRLIKRLQEEGIKNEVVLEVIRSTPRHLFMDEAMSSRAYEDTALPIGHGQTISQPYIVARMTEVLIEDGIPEKVLEVGTGSGYQTAVLAQIVNQVYTVERISALLSLARQRLHLLNLHNISFQHGDGYAGWEKQQPFDAILVTAAPEQVPETLLKQLKIGGKMIIPVGKPFQQRLLRIVRESESGYEQHQLDLVSFVPLVKGHA